MTDKSEKFTIEICDDVGVAAELSQIAADTFAKTFGHLYAPKDLAAFLKKSHSVAIYRALIADADHAAWLARDGEGVVAGYAVAGPCGLPVPERPASAGEVIRLYVSDAHRSGGVGAKMMTRALDWLEQRFEHVYLSVYSENTAAQRFYKRFGFEAIHEYFFMVGDQADREFIMERR